LWRTAYGTCRVRGSAAITAKQFQRVGAYRAASLRLHTSPRASKPQRPANAALRTREYLTPAEIERLIKAARGGRHGHHDATMILVAYRHGLRETRGAFRTG
jgi:uncharacterized protein (DUF3084 family)